MKLIHLLAGCAAVFITAALFVTIARSQEQSDNTSPGDDFTSLLPEMNADASGFPGALFLLNRETWELSHLSGKPIDGEINRPEAIAERYAANLATQNPEEYERIFPKTTEMRTALEDAVRNAQSPKTVETHLREVTDPGRLAEWQRAIAGILNPEPITDETIRSFERQSAAAWEHVTKP